MDEGSLAEEIEVLEAIYIEELDVQKNDKDEVDKIILQLHPATGEDLDQRFVCMTLILELSPQYPNVPPEISIKNPRGIAEEELVSLREDMHKLCEERRGGPVLFELIELAKDSLTAGNIPHCPCMICLEHFNEGEKFTKTECYHYFHEDCLARYVTHVLTKTPEIVPAHAEPSLTANKLVCPVCREEIHYKFDDFDAVSEEKDFVFTPTAELRDLQAKMAAVLERQKANGGVIDVEAERNKYLVKNDDVVLLALPKVENKQKSDRPRSGQSRYEKVDVEGLKEFQSGDSDRDIKGQGNYRNERRPKSDYMKGKGRGIKFNDRDAVRGKGKDRKEEKRKGQTEDGNDSGNDSGGRTQMKDECYRNKEDSGAKRKQWKEEYRNDKNRNYRGQFRDRRKQNLNTADSLKETVGNDADCQTDLSGNPVVKDSEGTKVDQQEYEDKKTASEVKDDKDRTKNQQTSHCCEIVNKGGFGRPHESEVDKKEEPHEEISETGQNFQKHKRGGFGRPPEKRFNKKEESLEEIGKTAQDMQKHRRGGFGRPEKNRYRDETYTDNRTRKYRGGFGKPGNGFIETSKEKSRPSSSEKSCKEDEINKHETKNETRSAEGSTTTVEITKQEDEDLVQVRSKRENANNKIKDITSAKGNKGGFGRPPEKSDDTKENSYYEVKNSSENNQHERGGFGKPEKKNIPDERYTEGRTRKNRGGFGKPKKDFKEKSEDMPRPNRSSEETARQWKSNSDRNSQRTEDLSKDEIRHEKRTGDRYFRDNRDSGNWRRENRNYPREERSHRDTEKNRYDKRSYYGDRHDRGYRENKGFSNNYHGKYGKQNRYENEDRFHNSDCQEDVHGSVRRNSGFQSSGDREKGQKGNRTENELKKYSSRNKSATASNCEQVDSCPDSAIKKFDEMTISLDGSKIHENSINSSVNKTSTGCDIQSADGRGNSSPGEYSDRGVKKEGSPGFAVSPPPGFQRIASDSTSIAQPPPGFS